MIPESENTVSETLRNVFLLGQREGRLGPGPIDRQIAHSMAFVGVLRTVADVRHVLDLGSGGGLPGLVVAEKLPTLFVTLLDGRSERARALQEAVADLGFAERVEVCGERAELAGRSSKLRAQFDVVVARSFAPPAVTAECAAPFLRLGGVLVVADPPEPVPTTVRWPAEGCAEVGLEVLDRPQMPYSVSVLRQKWPCSERFPRRVGIPSKRPLF